MTTTLEMAMAVALAVHKRQDGTASTPTVDRQAVWKCAETAGKLALKHAMTETQLPVMVARTSVSWSVGMLDALSTLECIWHPTPLQNTITRGG